VLLASTETSLAQQFNKFAALPPLKIVVIIKMFGRITRISQNKFHAHHSAVSAVENRDKQGGAGDSYSIDSVTKI